MLLFTCNINFIFCFNIQYTFQNQFFKDLWGRTQILLFYDKIKCQKFVRRVTIFFCFQNIWKFMTDWVLSKNCVCFTRIIITFLQLILCKKYLNNWSKTITFVTDQSNFDFLKTSGIHVFLSIHLSFCLGLLILKIECLYYIKLKIWLKDI